MKGLHFQDVTPVEGKRCRRLLRSKLLELDLEKKDEQVAQAHKCCKVVLEHCGIQHMTVPLWTMAIACEGYFCERKKPRAPLREIDPEQLYRRHALGAVSGGWTRSGSAS